MRDEATDRFNLEKVRREVLRWVVLRTLDAGGHIGLNEDMLLNIVTHAEKMEQVSRMEIRHELNYLEDREFVRTERERPVWLARITADGTDVVDYTTVPCPKGIGRPPQPGL